MLSTGWRGVRLWVGHRADRAGGFTRSGARSIRSSSKSSGASMFDCRLVKRGRNRRDEKASGRSRHDSLNDQGTAIGDRGDRRTIVRRRDLHRLDTIWHPRRSFARTTHLTIVRCRGTKRPDRSRAALLQSPRDHEASRDREGPRRATRPSNEVGSRNKIGRTGSSADSRLHPESDEVPYLSARSHARDRHRDKRTRQRGEDRLGNPGARSSDRLQGWTSTPLANVFMSFKEAYWRRATAAGISSRESAAPAGKVLQ